MDLDILGFIDHNITVNIIKDSQIVDKKALHLPKKITNVIRCKNPRCITSIEQELDHVFVLTDPEEGSITAVSTAKRNITDAANLTQVKLTLIAYLNHSGTATKHALRVLFAD